MKTKHILALLLAAAMTLTVASCGDGNTDSDDSTDTGDNGGVSTIDYGEGLDENGFFAGIKASDFVKLPEYKGIEIEKWVLEAAEDDIQEQIDQLLASHASESKQITDRAVVDGDTLNIDCVGSVDGVEFEGGSTGGEGTEVTIGVTNYIDDFLEQLIGHMPGETFDIEVTFPEDYGKEDLNGKDAIFKITINHIVEAVLPELTDEFASTNYGFETADALKADIAEWLVESQLYNVVNELLLTAECEEYPESVLKIMLNDDLMQYEYYAQLMGITTEEYITTYSGYTTIESYYAANLDIYKENAKLFLANQAVAELEGITVTAEDLTEYGFDSYIETYGEPYLKRIVLINNIIPKFIRDNAVVVD